MKQKIQGPKGTRDFYPQDMAWRNYITDAWRKVSERNGFEQVDGPIFESLELYKVKSGQEIVSELFHFEDRGQRQLAIRPEFTPTLARMIASKANALTKPIKWFCTSNFCRAERPQRGRLREFWQWNVDLVGLDGPQADAEVIFTAIDLLRQLGLTPKDIKVKISHRITVKNILTKLNVPQEKMDQAFKLLDGRDKMSPEIFAQKAQELGLNKDNAQKFDDACAKTYSGDSLQDLCKAIGLNDIPQLSQLHQQLKNFDIAQWCEFDLGIVRGLAYYTGMVFEIHETQGAERALAGGGRYDQLIQMFGGPAIPACGFGMGDVVLGLVLQDKNLVPERIQTAPDFFVIATTDLGNEQLIPLVSKLRWAGRHARFSYKTTRNLGKLMKEASASGAAFAIILDDKIKEGILTLKDLVNSEQQECPLIDLIEKMGNRI